MSQPQPQGAMVPQFQADSISGMCNECIAQMPWTTRKVNGLILIGSIVGLFAGSYTQLDTMRILEHYEVYRLFLSPIISASGFSALFNLLCVLFVFAHGSRVEGRKGSMFMLYACIFIALVSNLLLFTLDCIIYYSGQSLKSNYISFISAGAFPLSIGILTLECVLSSSIESERRFMCFPCNVPTAYYPLALVFLFEILGLQLDLLCGLAAGYLVGLVPLVQPGIEFFRRVEGWSVVRRWTTEPMFFRVDNLAPADSFQPFGMGFPQQQSNGGDSTGQRTRPTFGSGRLGNVVGMSDLSSQSAGQNAQSQSQSARGSTSTGSATRSTPSVFSGQGHKLGSTSTSTTSSSQPIGGGVSTAESSHTGVRSALADRYERMARGGSSTQSPSTAITIVPESMSSTTSGPASMWPRRETELAPMPIASDRNEKKPKSEKPTRTNRNGYAPLSTEVDTMSDDGDAEGSNSAPMSAHASTSESSDDPNVRRLMERGFSRSDAENALLVSNGNFDEALEYLS